MTDLEGKLERFETLAAECELIAKLATAKAKRELYSRLALHYRELATDMRKAVATKTPRSIQTSLTVLRETLTRD